MRERRTLLFLVVFATLLVYVVRVELPKRGAEEIAAERLELMRFDPERVRRVSLETDAHTLVMTQADDGRWHLSQPLVDRADDAAVRSLLTEISPLISVRAVGGGKAQRVTYRLDRPGVVATFGRLTGAGMTETVLRVGRKNVAFDAYYAIVDDDTTRIGLIDARLVENYLMREPMSYRNVRLADFGIEDPKRIVLATAHERVIVERRLGTRTWSIVEPIEAPADQPVVNDLIRRFSTQRIETFVEEAAGDLRRYGLDPPSLTITVVLENELSAAVNLGGIVTGGEGVVYARRGDQRTVFTIPRAGRLELSRTLFELREKRLLELDPESVDRLEIDGDGSSFVAERGRAGWRLMTGEPLLAVPVEQAVHNLTVLEARAFIDDLSSPAVRALDAPLVTATLTTSSGEDATIVFARAEGTLLVRVREDGPVAEVDADDADFVLGILRTPPILGPR